jgi:hypothetical protein
MDTSNPAAHVDAATGSGGRVSSLHIVPSRDLLRTRAPLFAPALMVGALSALTVAASLPLVHAAYAARPELLRLAVPGLWTVALLAPVGALAKGAVLGGAAWSSLVVMGVGARFRSVVSALVYAQAVLVLQGTWVTTLLWLRGPGRLHDPGDLLLPVGLDALVTDRTSALAAVARCVTPFHLVWLALLMVLLTRVAPCRWWQAGLAALVPWVLGAGLSLVRVVMG